MVASTDYPCQCVYCHPCFITERQHFYINSSTIHRSHQPVAETNPNAISHCCVRKFQWHVQLIVLIFVGFVSKEGPVSSNFSSILCFLSFLSNTCLLLQNIFISLYINLPGTSTRKFFCEVTFCCMFRLRNHIAWYHIPYSQ